MNQELPRIPADEIQPWGHMLPENLANAGPRPPIDFRLCPSEESQDLVETYDKWRLETLALIKKFIWPQYIADTQEWEGASIAFMGPLTDIDLKLLVDMQSRPMSFELRRPVRSTVRSLGCPPQQDHFGLEDDEKFADSYLHYDRTIAGIASREALDRMRNHAMLHKVTSVSSQFKSFLQRPRPYQSALHRKLKNFPYQFAKTANTPSICSGHCVQGLLSVGGIMERFMEDRLFDQLPSPGESMTALQQWAVDIGDRRVMAGVHYPSDNLCSWLIFLRLAGRVYRLPEIKTHLWNAVKCQSFVYAEIARAAGGNQSHPYTPILKELDRLAVEQPCC